MKAVIDSDVLIDYLQGIEEARTEIARYTRPCYSVISWMEIMCGAHSEEERQAAESLFASMTSVEISKEVARKAVEERRQLKLKLLDAVILASADIEGCILVTRNTRDFDGNDPRIRFPYSL